MSEHIKELNQLLATVQNPATHQDVVSGGNVDSVTTLDDGKLQIALKLPADRKLQLAIEAQIRTGLSKSTIAPELVKVKFVDVPVAATTAAAPGPPPAPSAGGPPPQAPRRVPKVKQTIIIGSGKGGVGKSTVSANMAFALAAMGKKVGLMDADIYGPSLGKMTGKPGRIPMNVENEKLIPIELDGVKVMSFAFLIDEKQPVVWRGPMLGKAVEQFLYDVDWGELDYLVIDLPPGTGDVQLSLAQLLEIDAAIIVTTPQNVALQDATRASAMLEQVNIPVIGVIENMSEFICPHCQKTSQIFSSGGGSQLANHTESVLLGQIPLSVALMESGEKGVPICAESYPEAGAVKIEREAFGQAAAAVAGILQKLA